MVVNYSDLRSPLHMLRTGSVHCVKEIRVAHECTEGGDDVKVIYF